MGNRKSIIVFLIISIISIISISTYAWMTWSSPDDTELTITVGEILDVIFKKGNDINVSNIGPVLNPDIDGEMTEFAIVNKSSDELKTTISMNITTLPNELKVDSFRYKLLSSIDNITFTEIANGSFKNMNVGDNILLEETPSVVGKTYYKFIIYLDGTKESPSSVMGKNFSGMLNVKLGGEDTLAELVMGLAPETVGWEKNASGVFQTPEGDYRYVGANVDNYVSFNNDLYRIIGVFGKNTHNQDGMLVKLIAANPLNSNSWGAYNSTDSSGTYSSYKNDWTGNGTGVKANLNVLLNNYFYTKTNPDPTYGECGAWTYYHINNNYKTKDCSDILGYGIDGELQNYISDARWHLYGYNANGFSKQNFYQCERGLSSDTTNCLVGGTTSAPYSAYGDAKIGLMYASDYLYASSAFGSADTTTASTQKYGNQNWLYKGSEWTITPRGGNATDAFRVYGLGPLNYYSTYFGYRFRPSFYLKSNIYVTSGKGTINKPYTIMVKE